MKGRSVAAAVLVLAGAVGGLYQLKYRVAVLEKEEARLIGALAGERQAIHVLSSEWAYLNDPGRLADLAARHLDVVPLDGSAMIALEELPRPPVPAADTRR